MIGLADRALTCKDVTKKFSCGHKAVDSVSFHIKKGECLGLVGESGSGKSTLARCLLQLEKMDQGEIFLANQPLHGMNKRLLSKARRHIQAVLQNPTASLNPRIKIIDQVMEPLDVQKEYTPSFLKEIGHNRQKAAHYLMEMVGVPSKYLSMYPHELSGGQKQRVNIARAISIEPSLIILDEPTASLDVSIQAMILNLLKDLQESLGLSYLFISHDLAAVNFISHRIMVMQNGKIVDECKKQDLFSESRHSYTKNMIRVFES
ncbi:dipeptide/oligopeptide/nickel ABC transporter ATP-binding protein [Mesobacillus subterraneus]|uniref:ATP-binding cassette domain-containing protein n=1 Tax=Mesobacillus subterraneus TaxID=285983 RepID=UPI001CFE8DFC|nr:dipeptide/oligopeptide/nickel ABC transporter ATP-binding protein [Mesobacillus subterraneus]WLR54934.1 dipeptide/oligopeptide/nickel ABC transporter ATP-binding protein [Mesobacillus subterraneus]